MAPRYLWIEAYRCGCSSQATRKKDLLGYCAKHGEDRNEIHKVPWAWLSDRQQREVEDEKRN